LFEEQQRLPREINVPDDQNSFTKRTKRYASVGGNVAKAGAKMARARLTGDRSRRLDAGIVRAALGNLKGPLMKVAQLLATIPDFLPQDYARELAALQSDAPAMGWPFVRRRMAGELGADWQAKFSSFEQTACSAASLGQVHRAVALDGVRLACKLQYPDMDSTVEADLQQLKILFSLFETFDKTIATHNAYQEIGVRLREELDYAREAQAMALYADMLSPVKEAHIPVARPELSTHRLLTMSWMDGQKMMEAVNVRSQEERNAIAINMFKLWYHPFYHYGVIHGDPHMGNYSVREDCSINLLDFGCIRVFDPRIVQAVITLYHALRDNDEEQALEAYRLWGFTDVSKDLLDVLTLWARFIYTPILEDSARPIDETNATAYGRETAAKVHRELKKLGGVAIPPEFVMIDRASIGLGSVFLHLKARVNWCRLFHDLTEGFDVQALTMRQADRLKTHRLDY